MSRAGVSSRRITDSRVSDRRPKGRDAHRSLRAARSRSDKSAGDVQTLNPNSAEASGITRRLIFKRYKRQHHSMSNLYPDEALDYPIMNIADIICHDLDDRFFSNGASQMRGLYALALALAWRLQSYPMAERTILCEGLIALMQINALELGESP